MILSHAFLCTFIHTAYLREGGSYQWASQNLEQVPTKIQSQGFFRLSSFSGRQFNIASCLFSTENFKRLRILLLRRKQKQSYLLPFEYKPWKKNHACKITFRFVLRSYLHDVGLGFSEAFNILRQTFMTAFFTLSIVSMRELRPNILSKYVQSPTSTENTDVCFKKRKEGWQHVNGEYRTMIVTIFFP